MTSTNELDTLSSSHDLPPELKRQSDARQADLSEIAAMVSGIVPNRQQNEVIPPSLLCRNLVVPGHEGEGWAAPPRN